MPPGPGSRCVPSEETDTQVAALTALNEVRAKLNGNNPDFAVVSLTANHDVELALSVLTSASPKTAFVGGTTSQAILRDGHTCGTPNDTVLGT